MAIERIGRIGMKCIRALWLSALFSANAFALDISVPTGFKSQLVNQNVGGGVSYLPDGDAIGFTLDYVNGPAIFRFDANGDGFPAGGSEEYVHFDSSIFPDFVQVAPSGKFALFGVTGSEAAVYRLDLQSKAVTRLFLSPGNYEVTFLDDDHAYLSSNPEGFNPSGSNVVDYLDLTGVPTLTPVIRIPATPSGPIAVNASGDLYYIRGTFSFPAPPGSSALLKFSASSLVWARVTGNALVESDAERSTPLDGGYDLVFHKGSNGGEFFLSTISDKIFRIDEATLAVTELATFADPTFPAATFLTLLRPTGKFEAGVPAQAVLGIGLATDFFSTFSFVQVFPETLDSDGDQVPDASDQCLRDSGKSQPLKCGCGSSELDSNKDGLVDCGVIRNFTTNLRPEISSFSVSSRRNAKVTFEKLAGRGYKYEVELREPGKNGKTKKFTATSNVFTVSGLKKGSYTLKYRIVRQSGKTVSRSKTSAAISLLVK